MFGFACRQVSFAGEVEEINSKSESERKRDSLWSNQKMIRGKETLYVGDASAIQLTESEPVVAMRMRSLGWRWSDSK